MEKEKNNYFKQALENTYIITLHIMRPSFVTIQQAGFSNYKKFFKR